jgi:hypothetical protein
LHSFSNQALQALPTRLQIIKRLYHNMQKFWGIQSSFHLIYSTKGKSFLKVYYISLICLQGRYKIALTGDKAAVSDFRHFSWIGLDFWPACLPSNYPFIQVGDPWWSVSWKFMDRMCSSPRQATTTRLGCCFWRRTRCAR